MKLIVAENTTDDAWHSRLGCPQREIIDQLLDGDWFRYPQTNSIVLIESHPHQLGMQMSCFKSEDHLSRVQCLQSSLRRNNRIVQPLETYPNFEIIFDYLGHREDVRLKHVFFEDIAHQGCGKQLLSKTATTSLNIGASNIFVEPAIEGSVYWPSSGAIIQYWLEDDTDFSERVRALTEKRLVVTGPWTDNDLDELRSISSCKDVEGLNKLFDKEGVFVFQKTGFVPVKRYLFEDIPLGECVFKLQDPITQTRFLKRTGIDLAKKFKERENDISIGSSARANALLRTRKVALPEQRIQ